MKRSWMVAGWLGLGAALPAMGAVNVDFDLATMNELLPALSANEIEVPITEARTVGVFLDDLRVTGLDPAAENSESGHILTSMIVRIPQLGVRLPVEPRLSLHVLDREGASELELRFEKVPVSLPLVGVIDIARFLPPMRFPADSVFLVAGVEGDVEVRSRLAAVRMGRNVVRLEFDLQTVGD